MTVRIGLVGLGRIGRDILRSLHGQGHGHGGLAVAAIAEAAPAESAAYLLKYDSLRGRLPAAVHVAAGRLQVGQHSAAYLVAREPAEVDWAAHGVEVVIECSDRPRSRAELDAHLARGARHVIACGPGSQGAASFAATVVMGHSDHALAGDARVVGLGSADVHAAVLCAAALAERHEIARLFCGVVRAYGADQCLTDGPGVDLRRARAAAANIVPVPEAMAEAVALALPQLAGRVSALDLRVPVACGHMLDMTVFAPGITCAAARAALDAAAARLPHILGVCDDPLVSSDVQQHGCSAVVDAPAMLGLGDGALKLVAWYDSGWATAQRALELTRRLGELAGELR